MFKFFFCGVVVIQNMFDDNLLGNIIFDFGDDVNYQMMFIGVMYRVIDVKIFQKLVS